MNPPAEDELDGLLTLWSADNRLTDVQADAILTSIVRSPSGLDAVWLHGLIGRVNGMVAQAAVMPEAARAAVRRAMLVPVLAPPA